ncbi:ThiF family adenylyltransferase [Ramlibacter sp. WS9]|uniref:ThiF family adenylyltransferase n=1 Tax=Ramlibacter sp. WS9 TaxID=1882741 RepID=UPI0011426F46|nr:ThiF family adenylyltransferase [Ramlibacter sp. WS9]
MTQPSADPIDTTKVDAAFREVQAACARRGIACGRLSTSTLHCLAVELTGATRTWPINVDCDEKLLRLPHVWTLAPTSPLAHVSYGGTICIDDGQGMSLDPERLAAIVAHTVIKAFDLLENSAIDAATGYLEFFNELEGYWSHLPDSLRSRAYFEVDGNSRMVQAFFKSDAKPETWYFADRGAELPWDVKSDKLEAHRALYVHFDAIDLPPVKPQRLTSAFVHEVHRRLSAEQLTLWEQLVGSSKNSPKRVALLVSVPRQAGGRSLVAIAFRAKRGLIDDSAVVAPLTMRRHTPTYMRERGGASLDLLGKHVAVLGAGAVGCVVIDTLAAAGIGQMTVVDNDEYSEDNVFRHLLEPLYIGLPKPLGVKLQLQRRYPGLTITPVCTTAQKWLASADLTHYDGIVLAFGAPTLERSFSRALKGRRDNFPIVFTWLEAVDVGGHSVLMWSKGEGCLDCLYRDDEGHPSLASRTSFLVPNQPVTRNLTGCAGAFVPFGALQARRTGLLAAEHILSAISAGTEADGVREPSYRFWVGEGRAAADQGLGTTPWFSGAGSTSWKEASSRAFGRACKYCRTPREPA